MLYVSVLNFKSTMPVVLRLILKLTSPRNNEFLTPFKSLRCKRMASGHRGSRTGTRAIETPTADMEKSEIEIICAVLFRHAAF